MQKWPVALALVLLLSVVAVGIGKANRGRRHDDPRCLSFQRVTELKGDHVNKAVVRVVGDVVAVVDRETIALFDMRGRYLRSVGRKGRGPGEFDSISDLLPLDKNRFVVFESDPPRATVLRLDGTVEKTFPLPLYLRTSPITSHSGSFLLMGEMLDRDHFSKPIVELSSNGGLLRYFGDFELEQGGALAGRMMPRWLAIGPDGQVVSVKKFAYVIEQWDSTGRVHTDHAEAAEWLRWPPPRPPGGPHKVGAPENLVLGAQIDGNANLWILAQVTPNDWMQGVENGRLIDQEKWTDTRLHVVDLETKNAICSIIFKPFVMGFAGPRIITAYKEDDVGEPTITLWRVLLRAHAGS